MAELWHAATRFAIVRWDWPSDDDESAAPRRRSENEEPRRLRKFGLSAHSSTPFGTNLGEQVAPDRCASSDVMCRTFVGAEISQTVVTAHAGARTAG